MNLTRRSALFAGASLPALPILASTSAVAGGHAAKVQTLHNTMTVGDMEVSTLLAGTRVVEEPQKTFGMNVSADEFAKVSQDNFIPVDKTRFFFTPTVAKVGDDVILFDAGLNAEGTTAALAQAGIEADAVTVVVVTHSHGDHIGGLTGEDGMPTYKNARYAMGEAEYNAMVDAGNEGFDKKVKPLAEKMTFLKDGDSVVSGVTAVAAFGHSPGHMTFMLESNNRQMLVAADTANHYVWSLAYPEWEVRFDRDKAAAAATRKKIFGMLAADKIPFIGYHMPFPGAGFVETANEGMFRYVPVSYQFSL